MAAHTVMLIEDDPNLRFVFTHLVKQKGYEVIAVRNAEEAFAYTRDHTVPSLIFLDLTLPGMGGVEYRRKQMADPVLSKIPLVLTSGRDDLRSWATKLGVEGYLKKPYSIDELFQALDKYCSTVDLQPSPI